VEEADRLRVSAVLAAHAELEVCSLTATSFDGDPHKLAHALLVDRGER